MYDDGIIYSFVARNKRSLERGDKARQQGENSSNNNFCHYLVDQIAEADWPIIFERLRVFAVRNEGMLMAIF